MFNLNNKALSDVILGNKTKKNQKQQLEDLVFPEEMPREKESIFLISISFTEMHFEIVLNLLRA